jgi:hypothetical protein
VTPGAGRAARGPHGFRSSLKVEGIHGRLILEYTAVLLSVVCSHLLGNPDDRPKGQAAIAGRGFALALVL